MWVPPTRTHEASFISQARLSALGYVAVNEHKNSWPHPSWIAVGRGKNIKHVNKWHRDKYTITQCGRGSDCERLSLCSLPQALHSCLSPITPREAPTLPHTLPTLPTSPSGDQPQPFPGSRQDASGGGWPRVPEEGLGQVWGLCGQLLAVSCHLRHLQKLRCAMDGGWDVLGQLVAIALN